MARVVPGTKIELCSQGSDADQRNYVLSCRRIAEEGFQATIGLEKGIRELAGALRWIRRGEL